MREYVDRAEYLKKVVEGEIQGGAPTGAGAGGATGQSLKPKGANAEVGGVALETCARCRYHN